MSAIKGAGAIVALVFLFAILPPDRDPVFSALSLGQKFWFIASWVTGFWGAVILFAWGVLDHWKVAPPSEDTSTTPSEDAKE